MKKVVATKCSCELFCESSASLASNEKKKSLTDLTGILKAWEKKLRSLGVLD